MTTNKLFTDGGLHGGAGVAMLTCTFAWSYRATDLCADEAIPEDIGRETRCRKRRRGAVSAPF